MIKEIRKAAPILALRDPPTKVILVDLQNAGGGGGDDGSRGTAVLHEDESRRRQGSSRSGDPALPAGTEDILAKRQLAADVGVTFGDGPDLRYRSLYSNREALLYLADTVAYLRRISSNVVWCCCVQRSRCM